MSRTEESGALLSCRGLTRTPWFVGRDLDLRTGEIVLLTGPSGSGKTLFLRALADLDPAEAGAVSLRGTPRESLRAAQWRARVLYVHQGGVRLAGTAGENVDRVLALAEQRARPPAPRTPVPGVAESAEADRLSGGERQAVALHRALLCAPDVLLLDEATSGMDPGTARAWEARLRAWADEGRAILWVTHDERLAGRVGARVERFP